MSLCLRLIKHSWTVVDKGHSMKPTLIRIPFEVDSNPFLSTQVVSRSPHLQKSLNNQLWSSGCSGEFESKLFLYSPSRKANQDLKDLDYVHLKRLLDANTTTPLEYHRIHGTCQGQCEEGNVLHVPVALVTRNTSMPMAHEAVVQ